MIQFDQDARSQCTLGGIVIRVKSRRPGNISLSVAIAGPVTLTRATTNTGALLHSDGMHRVSFYFLKIPMDRMPLPPGVLRTHTHTSTRRVCTRRVESALVAHITPEKKRRLTREEEEEDEKKEEKVVENSLEDGGEAREDEGR